VDGGKAAAMTTNGRGGALRHFLSSSMKEGYHGRQDGGKSTAAGWDATVHGRWPDVTICGDWSLSSLNSLFITLVADLVQLFQLFF
jgi:SLT domain-containing protein